MENLFVSPYVTSFDLSALFHVTVAKVEQCVVSLAFPEPPLQRLEYFGHLAPQAWQPVSIFTGEVGLLNTIQLCAEYFPQHTPQLIQLWEFWLMVHRTLHAEYTSEFSAPELQLNDIYVIVTDDSLSQRLLFMFCNEPEEVMTSFYAVTHTFNLVGCRKFKLFPPATVLH